MSKPNFELEEPSGQYVVLSYPAPGVLLVRLNRPKDLNCINQDGHQELDRIWRWLDAEPTLNVGVITGTGRAFCAGADLKGKTFIVNQRAANKSQHEQMLTCFTRMEHHELLKGTAFNATLWFRSPFTTKRP